MLLARLLVSAASRASSRVACSSWRLRRSVKTWIDPPLLRGAVESITRTLVPSPHRRRYSQLCGPCSTSPGELR